MTAPRPWALLPSMILLVILACASALEMSRPLVTVTVENRHFNDANVRIYCDGGLAKTFRAVTTKAERRIRLGHCRSIDLVLDLIGHPGHYSIRDIHGLRPERTLDIVIGPTLRLSYYSIR